MRRLWDNGFLRGLVLVALVSLAIVLLSLEESVVTAGALMRVAFFLAIAFFLFLLWRDRRSDLEVWSELSRRTFYGAIVLAVLAVGALIGLQPTGADALAFFVVLGCCAWAVVRVWRRERTYR
jgi:quinol-cytochrome oxidoreductase complex cytochrome b subunit